MSIPLRWAAALLLLSPSASAWPWSKKAAEPPKSAAEVPFRLIEVSTAVGIVNTHQKFTPHPSLANVGPYLAALGGASVAVVDYDGDGSMDVYLTNTAAGSKNKLFRNNHDGTFTEVAEAAGLADVNTPYGSNRALFFDYDNDGRPDLFLQTIYCPKLFHNEGGGRFKDVTKESGLDHCGFGTASTAVDVDGDGLLDLVVADYFPDVDFLDPKTTKFMWDNPTTGVATNGGPILVWHNDGGGHFSRWKGDLGLKSRGWTHAIDAYDLRGDGRLDLYFATCFGNDQLYLNEGGGRYRDDSATLDKGRAYAGMTAFIQDIEGRGSPTIFVSDIYVPGKSPSRNFAARRGQDGRWVSVSDDLGIGKCGWVWGAVFADLDDDGKPDLVLSNGMVSNDPKREYWYAEEQMEGAARSVRVDARNWPPFGTMSYAGDERDCVYWNRGGRFDEVSALIGFDAGRSDGRGIAAIDVLNDGRLSLVQANSGQPARFYKNETVRVNHWIGFALTGTTSNRDAVGAEVTLKTASGEQRAVVRSATGYLAQSDRRVHFGLGADAKVRSVEVLWPDGKRQTLKAPAADRYHAVTEPK